jgi:hypothetical protein
MMPSLFKYFAFVGAILLGLLVLLNSVLEPDGPRRSVEKAPPKPKVIVVKHDPRASLVERLRVEEAAQKAVARGETPVMPVIDTDRVDAVTHRAEPATGLAAQTLGEPAQASVPVAAPTEDAAARARRLAQKKAKAERARKQRLARAQALEQAAWRQPDQLYGYAPRPKYGPFGGWGQPPRW